MAVFTSLLAIAAAISLAAMSPGPSFVMVARTALAVSRRSGLAAALGMGVGAACFAIFGLFGLHTLLMTVPALYLVLKFVGGLYLLYLGYRIFRHARTPIVLEAAPEPQAANPEFRRYVSLGFFTQVSNPKTAVVYASVFVSLLPREMSWPVLVALPLIILVIEGGWYAIVALALSAAGPRAAYLGWKTSIDRMAGGVMAALGIKLLSDLRS